MIESILGSKTVKFLKCHALAQIPKPKSNWAAGADLHSVEHATIAPNELAVIHTGLKVEPPSNYLSIHITPRSGLAAKNHVTVMNSPGLIDPDYRGELMVLLKNFHPTETFYVNIGDRIAQMQIMPNFIQMVTFAEVLELSDTERGEDGLGSTGV